MKKTLFAMTTLAVSGLALAHPGHDHSAWTAPLLHALWIAPAVIATVAAVVILRKKFSK